MIEGSKISIVVPVYNLELYVEKTVKSICEQTYQNLEIILVDDGSNDETPNIIDDLAKQDERIHIIHKKNGGVTSARLCGVEVATGDWIGFVDGDDYIESNMYEILLGNAVQYQVDISHCGYQMVFPNRTDYYYGTGKLMLQDSMSALYDLLEGRFIEPTLCNKLYKRKLFSDILNAQKIDLSIKYSEDLLLNFYLFRESESSIYLDKCYYHYQVRSGSASTGQLNENKLEDPLKVLEILDRETKNISNLNMVVNKRMVSSLVKVLTFDLNRKYSKYSNYKKNARILLKSRLPSILKGEFSLKQKIQAIWGLSSPTTYYIVHKMYAMVSGTNKKYEVH